MFVKNNCWKKILEPWSQWFNLGNQKYRLTRLTYSCVCYRKFNFFDLTIISVFFISFGSELRNEFCNTMNGFNTKPKSNA